MLILGLILITQVNVADSSLTDSGQVDSSTIPLLLPDFFDLMLPKPDSTVIPWMPYEWIPLSPDSLPAGRLKKQDGDKWLGIDKFHHFTYSFGITGIAYHIYHCRLENSSGDAKVFSASLTAVLGLSKECYDKLGRKGLFSWKDLFFDALGISTAAILLAR